MTSAANKRSIMTLFSDKTDIYCHQVRIVLAEKGVAYETEVVDPRRIRRFNGIKSVWHVADIS